MSPADHIDRDQVEHMAQVAADNALWHRRKYKATGDREHLGQWKAYARGAWCLRRVEYSAPQATDPKRLETGEPQVDEGWSNATVQLIAVVLGVALGTLLAWLALALS